MKNVREQSILPIGMRKCSAVWLAAGRATVLTTVMTLVILATAAAPLHATDTQVVPDGNGARNYFAPMPPGRAWR